MEVTVRAVDAQAVRADRLEVSPEQEADIVSCLREAAAVVTANRASANHRNRRHRPIVEAHRWQCRPASALHEPLFAERGHFPFVQAK